MDIQSPSQQIHLRKTMTIHQPGLRWIKMDMLWDSPTFSRWGRLRSAEQRQPAEPCPMGSFLRSSPLRGYAKQDWLFVISPNTIQHHGHLQNAGGIGSIIIIIIIIIIVIVILILILILIIIIIIIIIIGSSSSSSTFMTTQFSFINLELELSPVMNSLFLKPSCYHIL